MRPTQLVFHVLLAGLSLTHAAHARAPESLPHIHAIAVSAESGNPMVATHAGIFELFRNGGSRRVSQPAHDFMALASPPAGKGPLYASGHPSDGGNLGVVRSTDGGNTWSAIAQGAAAGLDFHLLTVSAANTQVLYGQADALYASRDGGVTWQRRALLPDDGYALSASATAADRLYIATRSGLKISSDAGASWRPLTMQQLPASLVHATTDRLYAFVVGQGLLVADEAQPRFSPLANSFGGHIPLQLAIHPENEQRMYLLDNASSIWISEDGGAHWRYFLDEQESTGERETRGRHTYDEFCASCHGVEGSGETYTVQALTSRDYISAPALDSSAHAWHHTDEQLATTIREGSPRTVRMPAWEQVLTKQDINDVIAYIKSLWGSRELACQGPKHMNCPR